MGRDPGAFRAEMPLGRVWAPSGHSSEIGAGCGTECLAPRGWVLRAAMLMLGALLTPGGVGQAVENLQSCPRSGRPCVVCRGEGSRSFWLQPHPCPCPAMTPHVVASPSSSQVVGQAFGKPRKDSSLPHRVPLKLPIPHVRGSKEQAWGDLGALPCPVCVAASHFPLPPSPVPGRRAGAHVSPATCKSTDIIRAVVEGITGASACKAQVPCLGRWPGAAAGRGVRCPAIPLGMGQPLGWGEGPCAAVSCAGGAAPNWHLQGLAAQNWDSPSLWGYLL